MKQVLESLATIIAKSRNETGSGEIRRELVDAVLPAIINGEPRSRIKASINALEALLRKNAISAIELITRIDSWLLRNPGHWPSVLREECRTSAIDISRFLERSPENAVSDIQSGETAVQILILGFLNRSKSFDLAASSGELMTMFFRKLEQTIDSGPLGEGKERLALTWVKPIKYFLLQNFEMLEKLSNYILLRLFGLGANSFRCFLETLPLSNLLSGDMGSCSLNELTLLFECLQIGKKVGLVHDDCKCKRTM